MDEYSQIAHVIFGPEVKKRKERYYQLQKQLRQAHMAKSYEVYVSVAYMTSIILAVVGAMLGLLIGFLLRGLIINSTTMTNLHMPANMSWITPFASIIVVFVSMVILGAIGYAITFSVFLLIPSFNASERKSRINKGLPSAVTFMYAMSKGGADIITILRALYEADSTYGEVSREVGFVIRDMDYFGNDLRAALINCANQTPSDLLQDLMSNLLSVIDSGGDVTSYLNNKVEQYRMRIAQDQKSFLEILGLIAESYVTCFVAGPLFIIIMSSVMTIMNGGSPMILYIIIYAVLPLGSVIFIVMIAMMTPQDDETAKPFEVTVITQYDMLSENATDAKAEEKKSGDLKKARESMKFKAFMKNPLLWVTKDPVNILAISIPAAIIIIGLLIVLTYSSMTKSFDDVGKLHMDMIMGKVTKTADPLIVYGSVIGYFDDLIVYFVTIALTPLAFFHESKSRRERKIASEMPDFLKKLSSTNETGMTLTQSIGLIGNSNFGTLSQEVIKINKDLQWGTDVNTALKRFANTLRTSSATRVITLITKASESSGDIKDVLNIAANDARTTEVMRKDRFDGMLIYVVIIFISFLVFIYCVYTLTSSFIPVMASAASQTISSGSSAAQASSKATFIKGFNPDDYVRLFFHAAVIQGFFAGLLAGQMGEGKWLSGLKYSLIMMLISYVIFTVFI